MALHSVSSVSHVLRLAEPFPSLHNAHVLLDLAPLRRKPKRRTRRLTAFPSPSPLRHSAVKAVLHLDRSTDNHLRQSSASSSSDSKPQVANLEDIISERGACGVGFIANLENKASHEIVKDALNALSCMEHRGGCGADNDSGDGSGLMTGVPWDLFDNWANTQGIASFDKLHTGVGMVFLPKDAQLLNEAKKGPLCKCMVGKGKEGKRRVTSLEMKAWKCMKGEGKRLHKKNWLGEGHTRKSCLLHMYCTCMIPPFCPVIYCSRVVGHGSLSLTGGIFHDELRVKSALLSATQPSKFCEQKLLHALSRAVTVASSFRCVSLTCRLPLAASSSRLLGCVRWHSLSPFQVLGHIFTLFSVVGLYLHLLS